MKGHRCSDPVKFVAAEQIICAKGSKEEPKLADLDHT
jgi:hypothetical protein